jgi:alkylation response protein AidB-like acyl-CoA dehydrogenase
MPALTDELLDRLSAAAPSLEAAGAWPAEQFRALAEDDVLRWVIPREFGGLDASQREIIEGYERMATACLVTTFVLTQRNGACQRIAASDAAEDLKQELLPRLAEGELFATVGVSHLTTSRQHVRKPAVSVRTEGGDLVLSGQVPWVTGAPFADVVVTGGTFDDGKQALIALPTDADGVSCREPARLLALTASQTASIQLDHARVPARHLLAGPVEGVMKQGRGGGTGSVTTSSLAVGLSRRAVTLLERETERRPELGEITRSLSDELRGLRHDLLLAADEEIETSPPECSPESIRRRANSLALRSTQAALTASKGAGFVAGHPAERAVREAMFFLVWSCPQPVASAALREFACLVE